MTNVPFTRNLCRWLFGAVGAVSAFFAMLYFATFLIFGNVLPLTSSAWLVCFAIGLLVVLAGSLLVPGHQTKVALFLWTLSGVLSIHILGFQFLTGWLSVLSGGGIAVILVAWWMNPVRSPCNTRRVTIGIGAALLAGLGFLQAQLIDLPARPDVLKPNLRRVLGSDSVRVEAAYAYDLGGMVNTERLWRIDANSKTISQLIDNLNLSSTSTVPESFWDKQPYYWPRSMPSSGESFQSSAFLQHADGEHYFLMHDKAQDRAYIWIKHNF